MLFTDFFKCCFAAYCGIYGIPLFLGYLLQGIPGFIIIVYRQKSASAGGCVPEQISYLKMALTDLEPSETDSEDFGETH
jgi:hypothetical protein